MALTTVSEKKPLTSHQWDQINELLSRVDRAVAILRGNQEMGMKVPDIGVLGANRVRASKDESEPTVEVYFHIDHGRVWKMTVLLPEVKLVRYGSPSVTKLRSDPIIDKLPFRETLSMAASPEQFDVELESVEDIPKSNVPGRLISGDRRRRHRDEIPRLQEAHQLVDKWLSWLEDYLRAHMEGSSLITTTGVTGCDGTLYVKSRRGRSLKAIRPDGTVLQIGEALHDPGGEDEEAIRDKVEELTD